MTTATNDIDWRLETLPGVGAKTLESLQAANIYNLWQLLCHIPTRYEDYTQLISSKHWKDHLNKDAILIEGPVEKTWSYFSFGKRLTYCLIKSDEFSVRVGFFHLHPQIKKQLQQEGVLLRCYGKLVLSSNTVSMYHPKYWIIDQENPKPLDTTFTPVYKTIAGVTPTRLKKIIAEGLKRIAAIESLLTQTKQDLTIGQAIACIHQPQYSDFKLDADGHSPLEKAKWRLAQEEAAFWSYLLAKESKQAQNNATACAWQTDLQQNYIASLPFDLTKDQSKALTDIEMDLQTTQPMRRLLQGDVGCGKTVVATIAMLQAVDAGFQAAMLAPTVVLAKQHAKKIKAWLEPLGIQVELLISEESILLKQKRQRIANGAVEIVVGTHALLTDDVQFKALALVVIDEQHRFGVKQREALFHKGIGGNAHALVMSATPIPRTLAQSFFGVSDCSSIKSKPQNRKPIQTSLISAKKRDALLNRVLEQTSEGHQVYWVCPRVDKDDDAMSALQMFETVQAKNHAVKSAVLHGRMKAEEKMAVLESFSKGDVQLLVSTVVVEVGVDVPAATIMVIDHAQVFGLAQLHQLRGRVGRSDLQAYCILLYGEGVTEEGVERLQCLKDSNDGFELAEKDLALRGPGHILGFRQSGYPAWRFLQWPKHKHLIAELQQQKHSEQNLHNHYLAQLLWGQQNSIKD